MTRNEILQDSIERKDMTPKEILQALADGKVVEYRQFQSEDWRSVADMPLAWMACVIEGTQLTQLQFRERPDTIALRADVPRPITNSSYSGGVFTINARCILQCNNKTYFGVVWYREDSNKENAIKSNLAWDTPEKAQQAFEAISKAMGEAK